MTAILVMGVAGSGKTTIAQGLAERLGWLLLEGDAFHSPANVAKMSAGIPLTDDDRWPWLHAIAARLDALAADGASAVLACSALKRAYRHILIGARPGAILLYPRGSKPLIAERMKARAGHFMPPSLLDSQFAALEEPQSDEHPIIVDISGPSDAVIGTALHLIQARLTQGS